MNLAHITKSTSIHSLSTDDKLNRFQRYSWLLLNWLNNNFFPNGPAQKNFLTQNFVPDISEASWRQTDLKSSPSRKLSDLFWMQLPWGQIQAELGQINIFDTGCGSGNYGARLQYFSGGKVASYTGVDAFPQENWQVLSQQHPNFHFRKLEGEGIGGNIPSETNLFISQSAIEHFKYDLLYFKQIREFIKGAQKSVIQIHLFPARESLKLHLFHGVRQYTPRTISLITSLFQDFSYSILYQLGGRESNRLHWEFITKPFYVQKICDKRDTKPEEYNRKLFSAISTDNSSSSRVPSFYALIIHSNGKDMIFKAQG